jgi:type 1 fimbria pilin
MMTLIKSRLWCAVLVLTAQFGTVQAQTLIGFDFDTSNYPAWDVSGTYQLDQPISGAGGTPVPLSYSVYINHDAKGRLSGSGTGLVNIDGQVVAANCTLKGSVSGGGNGTRVNFSVNFKGKDWFYGVYRSFNGHVDYKLNVDPTELTLVGTARGNVSIGGSGGNIKVDAVLPLPAGVNGSWTVNMGVIPLKQFIGTGTIDIAAYDSPELPGGWPATRILYTDVKGSYNDSKNLANSNLNGIDEAKGSNLTVKFQPGSTFPTKMSGKVLGQQIKW